MFGVPANAAVNQFSLNDRSEIRIDSIESSNAIVNSQKYVEVVTFEITASDDNNYFQGRWVLNKEDFTNAEIHLITNR